MGISGIDPDFENDVFFASQRELFYIPYNNSKYIYHTTLNPSVTYLEWVQLQNIYNTHDGLDSGTVLKKPSVILQGENKFMFFGGDSGTSSYNNILRVYYWNPNTNQLIWDRFFTDSSQTPYKSTGYFYPLSRDEIIGLNCNYSSFLSFGETGKNIYYLTENDGLYTSIFYFFNNDSTSPVLNASKVSTNGGYFWKGRPKLVSYSKSSTETYTCFTLNNGYSYIQIQNVSYINPALLMGISDNIFLSIPKTKVEPTALYQNVMDHTTITKTKILDTGEHTALFKIPGIPAICYIPDVSVSKNATFYVSEVSGYPTITTPHSIVSGETMTENLLKYPKSSSVLEIQLAGSSLQKKIYGIRNDEEGINL